MKKRIISLILLICLLTYMFPNVTFADYIHEDTAKKQYCEIHTFTAIGDSICAGFAQSDYEYINGFDMMENIENSPRFCYARLVGDVFDSTVYNLGKCGCDTDELLDILADEDNRYHNVYQERIVKSDLITLGIGSNDLTMATVHSVLNCIDEDFADMSNQEILAIAEPMLTGNIPGIINSIEMITGINLSLKQIEAIQTILSDESLRVILEKAYETFCNNFPQILNKLHAIKPTADFIILNYYNPYQRKNFDWGDMSYNTGDVIQEFIDKMNEFTLNYCKDNDYLYGDISDTLTNIVDPHPSTIGHFQIASKIIGALLNTVTVTGQTGGIISPSAIIRENE